MNNELEIKQLIVEIGKRIWARGYVASNDGNISVKLNDEEIFTTPTSVSKGFMTTDMIIKVDYLGKVISGNPKYRPSSEVKMHQDVYKERKDIGAVVHAHPTYATSFAVAHIPLNKCVLPEAILAIGAVPIAKYGLPSTMEIPDNIREYIKKSDAVLLENHGALTLGTDLLNAYYKMETLEHTASIIWKAIQLGNVNVLPENERERLMALRPSYGLTGPIINCDTTPIPGNLVSISGSGKFEISEQTINEIVKKVVSKLRQK